MMYFVYTLDIGEVGFENIKKCLTCKYSITIIIILRNNIFRLSASFRVCLGTGFEKQRISLSRDFMACPNTEYCYIDTLDFAINTC